MLIIGEIITTSGFSEIILEDLKGPVEVDMVEKIIRIWNQAKMSIIGEVITTSGFFRSYFGSPKKVLLDWA